MHLLLPASAIPWRRSQKDFNELYPNVTIYYSADSSGTLQTQIEEGARCDLFFSAADKQMDALTEEKLTKGRHR